MIKSIVFKFLLVWSLFFLTNFSSIAQKHFNVIVNLPKGINKEKVEFWLGNGKVVEKIKTHPTSMGQLILKGDYYSLYAAIELQYSRRINERLRKYFFCSGKTCSYNISPT